MRRTRPGVADTVTERLLDRGSVGNFPHHAGTAAIEVAKIAPLLSSPEQADLSMAVAFRLAGGSILDGVFEDDTVTEVMINGPGLVRVERGGRIESLTTRLGLADIDRLIENLLAPTGRRVDRSNPVLDVRLDDRTRCHVVVPPVAVDGPLVSIRRFPATPLPLQALATPAGVSELRTLLAGRASLLVYGPTSSGKTSLIASLLAEIAATERIVVIEEAAEIPRVDSSLIRLEAQPANLEGSGGVVMEQLVAAGLRMRPDRIVIGEVRGSEAFDLLQALATGHTGSMATVHAADAEGALWRIASLAARRTGAGTVDQLLTEVRRSIDVAVRMERGPDGLRRVSAIEAIR
ncbi:MAG: CpaF family protein [Acidimicrobiales bacterium]